MSQNAQGSQDTPGTEKSGQDGSGNDSAPEGAAAGAALPAATPEERAAALEAERNETKDRMLRIAAEFENWKKRARKEQGEAESKAREAVLRDVLEIADNLERATSAHAQAGNGAVDAAAVVKGVNLVLRLLQQKLERHEVRPFDALGQPFDPRLHEAISRIESDVPAGSVAAELQKGYKIGERLLRPAMVSVSAGPKGKEPKEAGGGGKG